MVGRTANPVPGQKIIVSLSEDDLRESTVIQYDEHPIPGSCDLTTEFVMVDIPGLGHRCLTRHSILPESEQMWHLGDEFDIMVEVTWELD